MKQDLEVNTVTFRPDDSPESIKKDVKNFLLINLGLVSIIGVFMFIVTSIGNGAVLGGFPVVMMLLPALSVIYIKTKINGETVSPRVMKFYASLKWITVFSFLLVTVSSLIGSNIGNMIVQFIVVVYCLFCFFTINGNKEEFGKINMTIFKNAKPMIFILLYFCITKVGFLIFGNVYEGLPLITTEQLLKLVLFVFSFGFNLFLGWLLFFGEEFGWRGYLQPRMQRLFGNRMGIILVGVIWGLWHMPLCTMYYAPATPILCIFNHIGFCIALGIFIGYAYMKTENIWVPIMIHTVNNTFAASFSEITNNVLDLKSVLLGLSLCFALYGIFIFAKIFNRNRSEVSIDI